MDWMRLLERKWQDRNRLSKEETRLLHQLDKWNRQMEILARKRDTALARLSDLREQCVDLDEQRTFVGTISCDI